MSKLEVNKKLIGKVVKVLDGSGFWFGKVEDLKDENTFLVRRGLALKEVDIFDVRATD